MLRRINLSAGSVWRGYCPLEVLIDGKNVSCKHKRISYNNRTEQLKEFAEMDLTPVKFSNDWFNELDAFDIFSWREEYVDASSGTDGIWWSLTFEDGEKIYRGHGWNVSHKNLPQLMDWLGVIFSKEIE